MAEVEKSISISYKADLKDLVAKLKQMPNVTDQEAKKMVAALDRQLKQAEKAAQKSAEASKKAAQEASRAAVKGSQDFLDMADSAKRAEERLERVGEASGDIDRGFSSIGLALRGVNPQLAEAADGLADAFAVTEGLTMSFTALNPIVLAGAAAVGALTLGYMSYQQEIEKSKQLTLELRDAQKALNDMYRGQEANFRDSLAKLGEVTDEYAVLTGQIDEYELALRNTERSVKATFQGNIDQQAELIAQREEELALVENMRKSNLGSLADAYALSETEKETLKTLQLQTNGVNKRLDLTKHDMSLNNDLSKIHSALVNEIAKQEQGMAILVKHQEDAVSMALQIQEYENESAKAKEKQIKPAEKKVELVKEEKDGLDELIDAENKYFDKMMADNEKLEGYQIEAFMSKEQREALAFGNRLAEIEELGKATGQEALAQEIIKKMVHDKDLERLEELKEKRKEGFEANMNQALELGSTLATLAEQRIKGQEVDVEADRKKMESLAKMSDIERQAHEKKKKQLLAIFRFEQGMALAEIAMSTAEGIMAAQKLIPPFNIVQSALVAATGVAQAGVVMSQQPPSFHMGGMAPDEMGARVLKGEAILDRATVRSLGGEQGVKQIQQNQGQGGQVMIVQPFKHFGRYTREIGFRPPKKTGIVGY
jgi:hypothetical protein